MDRSQYEEDGEWRLVRTDVIVMSHSYSVHPFKERNVNFSEVSFRSVVLFFFGGGGGGGKTRIGCLFPTIV